MIMSNDTPYGSPRPIELLAPARNADIAIEAIRHGADAVYMGAASHGARAAAGNSLQDIARAVDYAHQFGARIYVTVNTIIYDDELQAVERLIHRLYGIGVDALIVQDMALLRMALPPIALHASTQCDIHSVEKARFLQSAGFSQLVVARELSIEEMSRIHHAVDVPLEAFVHGALCVSYSGDCQAGFATMGRSANRGECPQICRHKFDLTDADGRVIVAGKHLLSLRDLNRSQQLAAMLHAGISSFKIEGRLKDAAYVKNVVGAYRQALDSIIDANPHLYTRSSAGTSALTFTPDLTKSFNRGYTEYFTTATRPQIRMAAMDSPKWIGEPVGTVISSTPRAIKARLPATLANGDGLGYFDARNEFQGFRLNRIEGNTLFPAQPMAIPAGTQLYRNHDRLRAEMMESDTARRTIDVALTLRTSPWGIALDIADRYGHRATATATLQLSEARTPQSDMRRDILSKTGDTIFRVTNVDDLAGDIFIPKSSLAALRRDATTALSRAIRITHRYDYRRTEDTAAELPATELTYHDNVANRLAADFYRSHSATSIQPALETDRAPLQESTRIMTTRYCLRRELGYCLRTPQGRQLPQPLFLRSGSMRLALHFDCPNCRMHVHTTK